MKIIGILFIFICLVEIQSLLINKKSALSTQRRNRHQHHMNLKYYAKEIFNELNVYRRQKIFEPEIKWTKNLANTAAQEAFILSNHNNQFGDHRNFDKWASKYQGFTEIAINYCVSGRNTKKAFASGVLQALIDKYRANIVQKYKTGGVAIYPDEKNHDKFIIVLHLAQDGNGNNKNIIDLKTLKRKRDDVIRTYKSCQEAQEKNEQKQWILVKGKTTKCDYKFDGGKWTRVLDSTWEGDGSRGLIFIDDRNIPFKEVLFRAKKGYFFKATRDGRWSYDGYSFRFNALLFGDVWYVDERSKGYERYGLPFSKQFNFNKQTRQIKVFEPSQLCKTGGAQDVSDCAKVFKFTKFPQGRLKAFADIESTTNKAWFTDDSFKYFFEIFVR